MTRVIGRAEWGARYRDGFGSRSISSIDSAWLHHSVTAQIPSTASFNQDAAAIRTIEAIGQSRFNGGISYTYLVTPSARIFQGHSLGRIGAHTSGYNMRGVGICLVGNYETNEPTDAQIAAVVWILQNELKQNISGGHRDTKSTACPGIRAYSRISSIRSAFSGSVVHVSNPSTKTPSKPSWTTSSNTLRVGSSGPKVLKLQQLLNRNYPAYSKLKEDGDFGPATERVVKEFQRRSFITVDGVVGPNTREKLGLDLAKDPVSPIAPTPPHGPARNADGSLTIPQNGVRDGRHIARWQEVMGTTIDGVISSPSALIKADQRFLNRVVAHLHIRNLDPNQNRRLSQLRVDGNEGPFTIKVRQFWLRNAMQLEHQRNLIGKPLDFDGHLGPQTNTVHQFALNNAIAGSKQYGQI